jgi:hypothetical protein
VKFELCYGIPEMDALVKRLRDGVTNNSLDGDDRRLAKTLFKALHMLADQGPFYNGLQSHDIDDLTARYGTTVHQSYLENDTPSAGRFFWVYGPGRAQITVIGLEPHPEDATNGGYAKVALSNMPAPSSPPATITTKQGASPQKRAKRRY